MLTKVKFLLVSVLAMFAVLANAQVTTSSVSGKVSDANDVIIGATVQATHVPTGTTYGAITNLDGLYSINGMRAGGPYKIVISYVGYQSVEFQNITLQLGQDAVLDAELKESSELLQEVLVVASANSNMKSNRSGAVTSVNAEKMGMIPTVSRSMNDIMRLTPQGGNTGNGFAVGGGNYRQSYVTVDGAAMNNAFGIGSNLPAGGSPISLDALDQITVSVTPFDVRQSGFTGGAINAVTKSGTNQYKGSAYMYTSNVHLRGNKVGDYELVRNQSHTTTYGATIGGPIIKDKLFFFVNGEYEANVSAGPNGIARNSESDKWEVSKGNVHRPTVAQMDNMAQYLQKTYNYNPGRYQGYSLDTPAYKVLARLDWTVNPNNKVSLRFNTTHSKNSNNPSSSLVPGMSDKAIYPGNTSLGISSGRSQAGRTANAGLYFESSRYFQEQNFSSIAAEWNAKFGNIDNVLRATYSYQDEPRSFVGGDFPTVDILQDGATLASFGPDPFTYGNLRQVKTFVATDEVNVTLGKHKVLGGIQFETNDAANGFMQGGRGYYAFASWDDFVNGGKPVAYGITTGAKLDGSSVVSKMQYQQLSFYAQDQMNLSDNFKLTAGLRLETALYPALKDNFNSKFAEMTFGGQHYSTDQLPGTKLTLSPRVGFNWDLTGERKYVLRGGTGYFMGRLPFVWLVSAVGNSNCGQFQYYSDPSTPNKTIPAFSTNVADQIKALGVTPGQVFAPSTPTIIDKDLRLNAVWKTSLALDAKLPGDINFSLEGIYSKDFNAAVVHDLGAEKSGSTIEVVPGDTRATYKVGSVRPYYITNTDGNKAYSYSVTASLAKTFNFGLDLSASYTYSKAKAYGDGIGDQVSSAYTTNRYSVGGHNEDELGYGTYVSPNKLLVSAMWHKEYGKKYGTTVGLIYEGMNMGYAGGYGYTRFSYTMNGNVVGDKGANNLLFIPESREALSKWNMSAADQDAFWSYIQQDKYLKNHLGQYAERGGVVMPWHHQLDFKFNQDFYVKAGKSKNTLQLGVDIKNLGNLINSDWGLYKTVNQTSLITRANDGSLSFAKGLTETFSNLTNFSSTYSIQFSVRYIFN